MKRPPSLRPLTVCRHEAAHAVVAHRLGFDVIDLVVNRHGGHNTCGSRRQLEDPLRLGMVWMAGHAADLLWSRERRVSSVDHRALVRMGFRGESFPTLLALAQGQCIEHELQIRAVAAALKKGDLDRRAFLKALRSVANRTLRIPYFRRPDDPIKGSALQLAAEQAERLNKRGRLK